MSSAALRASSEGLPCCWVDVGGFVGPGWPARFGIDDDAALIACRKRPGLVDAATFGTLRMDVRIREIMLLNSVFEWFICDATRFLFSLTALFLWDCLSLNTSNVFFFSRKWKVLFDKGEVFAFLGFRVLFCHPSASERSSEERLHYQKINIMCIISEYIFSLCQRRLYVLRYPKSIHITVNSRRRSSDHLARSFAIRSETKDEIQD